MRLERLKYCALMLALLAGCDLGRSSTDPVPDSQQVLRVVAPPLLTLDPAQYDQLAWTNPFVYEGQNRQALVLLYSGLVTLVQNLRPVSYDADHIAVSPDGLTYTFHLRADLRFTDGAAITADDFAYSLNRAISPCGGQSLLLEHLKDAIHRLCGSGMRQRRPPGLLRG